jgi:hypothetical protein
LLDDLEKLPLSAAQLSRSVAIRHRWDSSRLEIEPIAALLPGAEYTLALPRKAAASALQPLAAALRVDNSPLAGAAVLATFPPAEAGSVPVDMAFALISFDGVVAGSEQGVWLEDERGFAHPAQVEEAACERYDTAAVSCVRVLPQRPLEPGARYALRSGSALKDGHGAALTELRAAFSTQRAAQEEPLAWQSAACAMDEQALPIGCALISDQHVELQLFQNPAVRVLAELDKRRIALLSAAASSPLQFGELVPDRTYTLILESIDASLHAEQISWPLRTAPPLPTLAISEVGADPNGSEPAQEYVELWNFGSAVQSLAGLHLSDDAKALGSPLPEQASVAPGAHALLVNDDFDPLDTRDQTPAPGSAIVRIGKSLTKAGLRNSGERLYLRTTEGYRVSTAPAQPAPREGQCLTRTDRQEDWKLSDCSPGR